MERVFRAWKQVRNAQEENITLAIGLYFEKMAVRAGERASDILRADQPFIADELWVDDDVDLWVQYVSPAIITPAAFSNCASKRSNTPVGPVFVSVIWPVFGLIFGAAAAICLDIAASLPCRLLMDSNASR